MIRCALFSYFGLREPDGTRGQFYYEVVAARLGFLIIFEHIVFLCKFLFQYLIPDVPQGVCMRVSPDSWRFVRGSSCMLSIDVLNAL